MSRAHVNDVGHIRIRDMAGKFGFVGALVAGAIISACSSASVPGAGHDSVDGQVTNDGGLECSCPNGAATCEITCPDGSAGLCGGGQPYCNGPTDGCAPLACFLSCYPYPFAKDSNGCLLCSCVEPAPDSDASLDAPAMSEASGEM
jgi:hypothetical protein